MLEIIFEDQYLIAVNKPGKILVHSTSLDKYENVNVQDLLSESLGYRVFPLHRLDKATSGVLLFSKDQNFNKKLHVIFRESSTEKEYLAICRGHSEISGIIEKPIRNPERPKSIPKSATTVFERLATAELPVPVSRYPSSRYSLLKLTPRTGRTHQLRMHMAHMRNYIIGDTKHGERHHNKVFKELHKLDCMFLHCSRLMFSHPIDGKKTEIVAKPDENWEKCFLLMSWKMPASGAF